MSVEAGAKSEKNLNIGCGKYAVNFDKDGNIRKIAFGKKAVVPPTICTLYEINGKDSQVEYLPNADELTFRLTSKEAAGKLKIGCDKEVFFDFEADKGQAVKQVGIVLSFPVDTVFHLAELTSTGRRIDSDMPVRESYTANLRYNFFLADCDGTWVRFRTGHKSRLGKAKCQIVRHPEMFTVTFTWSSDANARLAVFSSMDEAVDDYEKWLESECGMRKLKDKKDVPDWINDIKLLITVDMLNSNWEIVHDYTDLLNLAKEIKKIRDPKGVMFYIPGWHGAYDSTHPTYRPRQELGGSEKFKEMTDYLHENGFRLMIHATIYGVDPYHPNIDQLQELCLKDNEGNFRGFQLSTKGGPLRASLKFRTGELPLGRWAKSNSFSFETVAIPDNCEAYVTIGGLKAKNARVMFTVGRRTISTPPNWFADHNEYDFPFGLALKPGRNEIRVTVTGESDIDWGKSWYKIRNAIVPVSRYTTWTHPILRADTTRPEFIQLFTENIDSVVREFGIDAVHVDAGGFYWPKQSRGKELLLALKEKLSDDVAVSGEYYNAFEEMDFWDICGTTRAKPDIINYGGLGHRPWQTLFYIPFTDMDKLYAWLNKTSAVCDFAGKYTIFTPHLCSANFFVPVGMVCNTCPTQPSNKEAQLRAFKDAKRQGFVPALRVNYRAYGLDDYSKRAIKEIQ